MNRTFNFRAFEDGKMHYQVRIGGFFNGTPTAPTTFLDKIGWVNMSGGDRTIVMQSTGLKDKNGIEIYEGDVITHERYNKPYSAKKKTASVPCVVEWDSGFNHSPEELKLNPIMKENPSIFNQRPGFRAIPIDKSKEESGWGYDWSEFSDCEVIGNIYENPELIKN